MLVFCSLWGSPGVTTVAYRVASAWCGSLGRTTMLAECDLSGSDLAVRLAMSASPGMATLAAAARRNLSVDDIWEHVQEAPSGVGLLLGLTCAEHSVAFGSVWEGCARLLGSVRGVEVVVDAGRLEPGMAVTKSYLERAGAVLVCARPDASSLVHTARRIDALRSINSEVRLVLVGGGPYGDREAQEATGTEVIGSVDTNAGDRDWIALAAKVAESCPESAASLEPPPAPFDDTAADRAETRPTYPGESSASHTETPSPRGRSVAHTDSVAAARRDTGIRAVSIHEVRAKTGLRTGAP